jgi:hypothetical protein
MIVNIIKNNIVLILENFMKVKNVTIIAKVKHAMPPLESV